MNKLALPRNPFVLLLAFGGVLTTSPAWATNYVLNAATCQNDLLGTWTFPEICKVTNFALAASDTLSVPAPYDLILDGTCVNEGAITVQSGARLKLQSGDTLDNYGPIENYGAFDNLGDLTNLDTGGITNRGTLVNRGTLWNSTGAAPYLTNDAGGLLENWDFVRNSFNSVVTNSNATWKNRGDDAELGLLGGEFINQDGALFTNASGAFMNIRNSAVFTNTGDGTQVINHALGEVFNGGHIENKNDAIFESHGALTNEWIINNQDGAAIILGQNGSVWNEGFVENWCGGLLVNDGSFDSATTGGFAWITNYCDATLDNGGDITGQIDNRGGITINTGTWSPAPDVFGCIHR